MNQRALEQLGISLTFPQEAMLKSQEEVILTVYHNREVMLTSQQDVMLILPQEAMLTSQQEVLLKSRQGGHANITTGVMLTSQQESF